ncbi:MAG: ABC transporter ATP-binding protein [Leptolyngbyaceae cyanobacterium bins.59]|nr:ABC transporter ATP-binding protein [Leptolyngbyaceae cyanobacterium bins.59]
MTSKARSNYWHLLPYVRPHWQTIVKAFVCTIAYTVFWPILAAKAGEASTYIAQGNVSALLRLIGVCALIFIIRGFVQYGQDVLLSSAALAVTFDLRRKVYRHLQTLNLSYFETAQTGDLAYRLTEDIDKIGEVLRRIINELIPLGLQLIVVVSYMLYLNWQLTVAASIIAPLIALLIGWFGERLLVMSRRSQNRIADLSSLITEVFSGIRLVRAFAAEEYEIWRFSQAAEQNRKAKFRAERLKAIQIPVVSVFYTLSILFLLLLGAWQISQSNLDSSRFISYVTAVAMLIDPVSFITVNYNEIKQGEASVDRIFELMAIQPEVVEKPGAIVLPTVTGKVEYRTVDFAYQSNQPVLQNLNLLAFPGEMIALVGASGAGKTTLVNLLPRFYDPQAGQILIDGLDIREVTLASLRRQIGIVPQETILFSGTIAQNIAFGQVEFDLNAVEAAAKIANAHQFIAQFPEGYQTWVGERGVNLSGGQRQRIAIARAVLLNPRILILDEATSALDSESEALVQEALERLMQEKTVFIIAHRLATVRKADRILVVEKGQVVESGTHTELLGQGDRYARYYAQQFS